MHSCMHFEDACTPRMHACLIYVVAIWVSQVFVFDAQSLQLLCRHTPGQGLGSPHAMSICEDELFIADHDHHRVLALGLCRGANGPDGDAADIFDPAAHFTGGERSIGCRGTVR